MMQRLRRLALSGAAALALGARAGARRRRSSRSAW